MYNANVNEIKKRFRYSVVIDVCLMLMFCLVSGVLAVKFLEGDLSFIIPIQFIVISLYYLFGDLIFKNQSIGMRLMNVEVRVIGSNVYPNIWAMAKRRYLNLLKKSSFIYRKSDPNIDAKTGTYLIIKIKKNDLPK